MPSLALIDASGYLYRAFYAIRGLTGPGGRPTNAVYGFTTMLRKLRTDRKPTAIAVAFDRREKTFRHELDPKYKAQRAAMPDDLVPQIEDAKRLCRALGLAVVEEPGFEADDLIGTLARKASAAGLQVEIASPDKDLFQLVEGNRVVVWHPTLERILDAAGVTELFGVPPERVTDVLALMGDSSDNIPGVAGVGEKTAKELVSTYGSLEEIYAHLDALKGKRRELLEKGRDEAFRSRELATVRRDVPVALDGEDDAALLKRFHVEPLDDDALRKLAAFYDELGFATLKKELHDKLGALPAPPSPAVEIRPARWDESWSVPGTLSGPVGIHVETAPGRPFPSPPIAACVALADGDIAGGDIVAFPLDREAGKATLAALFAGASLVAHDAKRLFLAASALGIEPPARFEDVMLAAYVVSPGLHAHDLAGDARALLDRPPESLPSVKDVAGAAGFDSAAPLQSEPGRKYLSVRATVPLELARILEGKLTEGPRRVLRDLEVPLVPVLARMEIAGIAVDRGVLAEMSHDFEKRLASLEGRIHEAAGEPFNVGSPSQLGKVLFEKLGYPVLRKTSKTKSYSTDSDVLEELATRGLGPLAGLVLEWRELSKLKGTYVDALPLHVAKDGRIHTRYDQAVAATGRLSSNDPNLQNIPIRSEAGRMIRKAFVAPAGRVLVAADYSQIELRLLAHLSGDEALVEVFRRGDDIHRATAAKVFGIAPELVSPDQRRGAKTINFGILYGMSAFALAGQLGVPQSEAKAFIKAYFERFPKIRVCLDAILAKARETGVTKTIFGRVRPIPAIHDRNHAVRSNAERMAMNAPFQGSAADLIKRAMIDLDAALTAEIPSARLLLQVHDELVLECEAEDVDAVVALARARMEGAASLAVPLTVDVGVGRDWYSAK